MSQELIEYIKQWFIKADHDLIAAKTLIENNPNIPDVACFHCQQAVEKYLKAYLAFRSFNFRKTHDLVLLQKMCIEIDDDFKSIDLKDLNLFAVEIRYPDFQYNVTAEEAREYCTIAEQVKQIVLSKIKIL